MNHSRGVVVSYKRKYVHGVLVNCYQACPGKSVLRGTDRPAMTIAVDLVVKQQNKQKLYSGAASLILSLSLHPLSYNSKESVICVLTACLL